MGRIEARKNYLRIPKRRSFKQATRHVVSTQQQTQGWWLTWPAGGLPSPSFFSANLLLLPFFIITVLINIPRTASTIKSKKESPYFRLLEPLVNHGFVCL